MESEDIADSTTNSTSGHESDMARVQSKTLQDWQRTYTRVINVIPALGTSAICEYIYQKLTPRL
jgi:hypothetical protein